MELYAVGGCVRNSLLKLPILDLDLAVVGDVVKLTNQISNRLNINKVAVYNRFGTALLETPDVKLEFATARSESYSSDSRKPQEITPVPIEQDLKRRDFTINALALGLTGEKTGVILDLFNGIDDLNRGVLRTPLDPELTFSDDPLRIFRAIRFAVTLGFEIEERTWEGIRNNASRIKIVAQERLRDEFWKMLTSPDPVRAMNLLLESGLMKEYLPEVALLGGVEQIGRHHHKDVLQHSLKVLRKVAEHSEDPLLRLAALFHDLGKPQTKKFFPDQGWTFHGHEVVGARMAARIGQRMHLGKDVMQRLTKTIRLHMRPVNLTSEGVSDSAIRRLMVECGEDISDQLILCRADITSSNPKLVQKYLANFNEMQHRMEDVEARDKIRNFHSPVRGDEIIQLCQVEPGPIVGVLKERVEEAILDGLIPNDYEAAKTYLLKIADEVKQTAREELIEERRKRSYERRHITSDFNFPD